MAFNTGSGSSRDSSANSSNKSSPLLAATLSPITVPSSPFPNWATNLLAKHSLTLKDLTDIRDLLIAVAKKAEPMMMNAEADVLIKAQTKNNTSDLVTEYDEEIEHMVRKEVLAKFPDFKFWGEETHKLHKEIMTDAPTFVVDPIDGTINFTHGNPNFCISLALVLDKIPVVGVVYNPARGDLYFGMAGQGSYYTKHFDLPQQFHKTQQLPMRRAPMPEMSNCLLVIEWGNERKGSNWACRTSTHNKLLTDASEGGAMCKTIRSNGSAALNFCYVAQGIMDAFWEGGVNSWDVAAGWCILKEADGIVASCNPDDWEPKLQGHCYLAVRSAKEEEQKKVVETIWENMQGQKLVYKDEK